MDTRLCLGAIRVGDLIIYRYDLGRTEFDEFMLNEEFQLVCNPTNRGNIFYDGKNVILQEWDKYKVRALNDSFSDADFRKIGEYGSENYGTLLFKNCVGIASFKNIRLLIESPKISSEEMDNLIDVVNSYIINLSYDYNQATFSEVERDQSKKTDLDYHVYLLIHNALKTKKIADSIFSNFKLIENNPNRLMTSEIEYDNIGNVKEVTDEALIDIFSGSSLLVPCSNPNNRLAVKLSSGHSHFLPQEILYKETIDTFDNPENRFVKYFLEWCLRLIEKFQKRFLKQEDFRNQELIEYNQAHIGKLRNILQQSFLKKVGDMQSIPMYSTVLTRKDGYRQLFHMYLGIKSLPQIAHDSENIEELIENKSLDVLYENYSFFGIAQVLAEIYGEKLDKKKYRIFKTDFSKTLEKQTNSNFFEYKENDQLPTIRIHYNKNYVVESYSKAFDPDISLEIFNSNNEMQAIYIFDSKFKAQITSALEESETGELTELEKRKYKYDDISKMHTYRDALKLAKGAYILYPGTIDEIFYADETKDKNLLYGVGAFKLRPGNKEDLSALQPILQKLLTLYKTC